MQNPCTVARREASPLGKFRPRGDAQIASDLIGSQKADTKVAEGQGAGSREQGAGSREQGELTL